jgi:hypothetical protein
MISQKASPSLRKYYKTLCMPQMPLVILKCQHWIEI